MEIGHEQKVYKLTVEKKQGGSRIEKKKHAGSACPASRLADENKLYNVIRHFSVEPYFQQPLGSGEGLPWVYLPYKWVVICQLSARQIPLVKCFPPPILCTKSILPRFFQLVAIHNYC
jgi:hypothetical protein